MFIVFGPDDRCIICDHKSEILTPFGHVCLDDIPKLVIFYNTYKEVRNAILRGYKK